jgi:bacterioferritin (cytochrome b1)
MTLINPYRSSTKYRISQLFGENYDIYKRFNLAGHNGIDYALPVGTQLVSPIEGVVVEVDYDENGYGWYVKVENATEGALLAHMSEVQVQVGFVVEQGQNLGLSGNTGFSTGPHTHFGYYRIPRDRTNGFNGYIDPMPYFNESGDTNVEENAPDVISQELAHQYKADREMFWKQRDEALDKVKELEVNLRELKDKFDIRFKMLDELGKLGFFTIDDIKVVVEPYKDMFLAGFPNLQSVNARMMGMKMQIEDYIKENTTIKQQRDDALTQANEMNLKLTEVTKELEEIKKKIPLIDTKSTYNRIAIILEIIKVALSKKPKLNKVEEEVIKVEPEKLEKVITEASSLLKSIGINN